MPVPSGAIFEAEIDVRGRHVALYDVSHLLPTSKRRKQQTRDPDGIVRLYVHKSGGRGRSGFDGLLRSVRYVVGQRNFPGCAYTLWASINPDRDDEGRLVLYRGQPDEVRSWHTGGVCNEHGIALALQGNPKKGDFPWAQRIVAEAGILYSMSRYSLDIETPVSTHSRAADFGAKKSKPVCPGPAAEAWLGAVLGREAA